MATNQHVNKVQYGGNTLIDLTGDDVQRSDVRAGVIFHLPSGEQTTGTASSGGAVTITDTTDSHGGIVRTITGVSLAGDTVTAAHLESGYTAHDALGNAITGSLIPGSTADYPTFTAVVANETITSVTCDKTFAEVAAWLTDNNNAVLAAQISGGDTMYSGMNGWLDDPSNPTTAYFTFGYLVAEVGFIYAANETITWQMDPVPQNDSTDLTASGATVTAPAGYYDSDASKSVASGSATTPATTVTANPSISVSSGGLITATASATKSVTPTVSAGYVSSGTAGTISVSGSNTEQLSTQAAQTIHPSTTDQSIASGRYLTGAQTIKAVTHNLDASKILSGTTFKIGDSSDDDCVASVAGTVTFQTIYSGSSAPSSSTGSNGDVYIQTA